MILSVSQGKNPQLECIYFSSWKKILGKKDQEIFTLCSKRLICLMNKTPFHCISLSHQEAMREEERKKDLLLPQIQHYSQQTHEAPAIHHRFVSEMQIPKLLTITCFYKVTSINVQAFGCTNVCKYSASLFLSCCASQLSGDH